MRVSEIIHNVLVTIASIKLSTGRLLRFLLIAILFLTVYGFVRVWYEQPALVRYYLNEKMSLRFLRNRLKLFQPPPIRPYYACADGSRDPKTPDRRKTDKTMKKVKNDQNVSRKGVKKSKLKSIRKNA